MKQLIYLVPLLIALAFGKSVNVQRVVYSEGAIPEGEDDTFPSSQLEDIPPREQWFRVRGAHRPHHHNHHHQILSQSMSHGQPEVVELHGGRGWAPKRVVVAGAIENRRQASHVQPAIVRQDNENDQDQMQVHVRSRGKAGFQSRSMKKETESDENEDDDRTDVFTRRIGDRSHDYEEDRESRPVVASRPVGRQQNKHLHAHHQSGHNNRESTKEEEDTGFQAVSGSSRQQQPREPEVEEEALVVEDRNSNPSGRKQGGNVRQHSHQNDRRVEDDVADDEMEYEYEDVNEGGKSRNRNGSPAQALQVQTQDGPNNVIKTAKDYEQLNGDSPPPHEQVAKMARYIVHNSNWTSIATISTMKDLRGYPFANVISVSDGPIDDSKGTPYMYMTPLDMSAIDLKHDSRASLTMSLAQSDYCRKQEYDPEDPRCAHVILSGRVIRAPPDEKEFAMNALFSRHPEMTDWPKDHGFYFAKLDIEHIVVLDYFGGGKTVKLDDYFNQ